WWGINTPASTITNETGATNFTPFVQMTHTANPTAISGGGTSTLTADLSKDNNASGVALAGDLDVFQSVPVAFGNAVLGFISEAQPEALNPGAQATATFNSGPVGGSGHADATIDQQTITVNISILVPLQITKSFAPASQGTNSTSVLTFAIN